MSAQGETLWAEARQYGQAFAAVVDALARLGRREGLEKHARLAGRAACNRCGLSAPLLGLA